MSYCGNLHAQKSLMLYKALVVGVQGQQHGSWNPRMHVANPHTAPGIQPGLNYHAQAGMNPALAQVVPLLLSLSLCQSTVYNIAS